MSMTRSISILIAVALAFVGAAPAVAEKAVAAKRSSQKSKRRARPIDDRPADNRPLDDENPLDDAGDDARPTDNGDDGDVPADELAKVAFAADQLALDSVSREPLAAEDIIIGAPDGAAARYGEVATGLGFDSYLGRTLEQQRTVMSARAYGEFYPSPSLQLMASASALFTGSSLAQGVADVRGVYSRALDDDTQLTIGTVVGLERNRTLFADGLIESGTIARDNSRLAALAEVRRSLKRWSLIAGANAAVKDVETSDSYWLATGGLAAGARLQVLEYLRIDADIESDIRRVSGLERRDRAGTLLPPDQQSPIRLTTATAALSGHVLPGAGLSAHLVLTRSRQWEGGGEYFDGNLTTARVLAEYSPAPIVTFSGDMLWQARRYHGRDPAAQITARERNLTASLSVALWWTERWGSYADYSLDRFADLTLDSSESRHVMTIGAMMRAAD